jgi:IS30 family transposase
MPTRHSFSKATIRQHTRKTSLLSISLSIECNFFFLIGKQIALKKRKGAPKHTGSIQKGHQNKIKKKKKKKKKKEEEEEEERPKNPKDRRKVTSIECNYM